MNKRRVMAAKVGVGVSPPVVDPLKRGRLTRQCQQTKPLSCLTWKAALWYNLWSLAFLGEAGRGHDKGLAAPLPRLVPFLFPPRASSP